MSELQKKLYKLFLNAAKEQIKKPDYQAITEKAVVSEGTDLTSEITDRMYLTGTDGDGQKIEPEYKPFTVAKKKFDGQPHDRVTLKDTGAFYKSYKTKIFSGKLLVEAEDKKTEKLLNDYGEAIEGYQQTELEEFVDFSVLPKIIESVKKVFD